MHMGIYIYIYIANKIFWVTKIYNIYVCIMESNNG